MLIMLLMFYQGGTYTAEQKPYIRPYVNHIVLTTTQQIAVLKDQGRHLYSRTEALYTFLSLPKQQCQ